MLIIVNDIFAYLAGRLRVVALNPVTSMKRIFWICRFLLWAHSSHLAEPQEDLGGVHRGVSLNDDLCLLRGKVHGAVRLAHLPEKGGLQLPDSGLNCAPFSPHLSFIVEKLCTPFQDLTIWGSLTCERSPIYETRVFTLLELAEEMPGPLEEMVHLLQSTLPTHLWEQLQAWRVHALPVQLHAISMAVFASLISPFGEHVT